MEKVLPLQCKWILELKFDGQLGGKEINDLDSGSAAPGPPLSSAIAKVRAYRYRLYIRRFYARVKVRFFEPSQSERAFSRTVTRSPRVGTITPETYLKVGLITNCFDHQYKYRENFTRD